MIHTHVLNRGGCGPPLDRGGTMIVDRDIQASLVAATRSGDEGDILRTAAYISGWTELCTVVRRHIR
jgi:hypothetical protein